MCVIYDPSTPHHDGWISAHREPHKPILGLRKWRVAVTHGRLELASAFQDTTWLPGDRVAAYCSEGHRAGDAHCRCGFHTHHVNSESAQEIESELLSGSPLVVAGTAQGWGRLAISPTQVRSEFARPAALFIHGHHDELYRQLIHGLAAKYSSEAVEVTSAADILDWCAGRDGAITPKALEQTLQNRSIILEPIDVEFWDWPGCESVPSGFWPTADSLPIEPGYSFIADRSGEATILPVTGLNFHPGSREENLGHFLPGVEVKLVPEPENRFDPNAIAVFDRAGEIQLGYLPRELAARIDADRVVAVRAFMLCHWFNRYDGKPLGSHLVMVAAEDADRLDFVGQPHMAT